MSSSDPMATFKAIPKNDQIFLGVGLLVFVFSFFHFAGKGAFGYSYNISLWNGIGVLAMLLILLAMVVVAALDFARSSIPEVPVSLNFVVLAATALGALLIIIKAFTAHASGGGVSVDLDRRIAAYILIVLSVIQAGIAFIRFRDSGDAMPWDKTRSATPPTPPASPSA